MEIMERKVGVESVKQHSIWLKKKNNPKQNPTQNQQTPPTQEQINAVKTCDIKLHLKKKKFFFFKS